VRRTVRMLTGMDIDESVHVVVIGVAEHRKDVA
jgi:hypothetical protein